MDFEKYSDYLSIGIFLLVLYIAYKVYKA